MRPYEATRGSGGVPQVRAPFVGVVEIVCGSLLLIGLVTWLARCRFSLILRSPNIRPKSSRREELGFYRQRKHGAFVGFGTLPCHDFPPTRASNKTCLHDALKTATHGRIGR
jgi:hypothetical protein